MVFKSQYTPMTVRLWSLTVSLSDFHFLISEISERVFIRAAFNLPKRVPIKLSLNLRSPNQKKRLVVAIFLNHILFLW